MSSPSRVGCRFIDIASNGGRNGNAASLPVENERFLKPLKLADARDVKGAGATIDVDLGKSAACLDRLETCYATNGSSTGANPFVATKVKP